MKDVTYYMSSVNNIAGERAKLQAAMKKRKVEDKPQKEGLRLFNTSDFIACRDPADIARELYSAITTVPPRWTFSNTESRMLELVQAYEAKANASKDPAERVTILDEYFRAKKWHENFASAMHATEGAPRSRLYQAFNDGVVRGKWKDKLEETIKRVKDEYVASWNEKLYMKGVTKPEPKPKAAAPTPTASAPGAAGQKKSKFRFKNLTEYRLARVRSMAPAFSRPSNLPAELNKWCADCCWSDHVTEDCTKTPRQQRPQQPSQGQQNWEHHPAQQQQQYQQFY